MLLIGLSKLLSTTQIWLVKGNQHGISCARLSDVDLRGNQRWRSEMLAVFSGRSENESEAKNPKRTSGTGCDASSETQGQSGYDGAFQPLISLLRLFVFIGSHVAKTYICFYSLYI